MSRQKLTNREIRSAFDAEELSRRYPPVMTVAQVAELCQCSKSLVHKWSSKGVLDFAKSQRGPVRFWRDRVLAWHFGERGN